jgi:YD repeat-containing protein
VTDPDNLNSLGYTLGFTYDTKGNVTLARDANDVVRTFTYDVASNLKTMAEPVSATETKVTTFDYDAQGNLKSITDARNHNQFFDYDEFGNLLAARDHFGRETTRTYDELLRLESITDPLDRRVTYSYNDLDQLTAIDTVLGRVTYGYNAQGNLEVFTDANENETTFTYDPTTGDLIQVIDSDNKAVQYTYDAFGRMTSFTDPNGSLTILQYDELGRLTSVGADILAPRIADTQVTYGADDSVEILISVDEPLSEATFMLAQPGASTFEPVAMELVSDNQIRVVLRDLTPNTFYNYEVWLTDQHNNRTVTETASFRSTPDSQDLVVEKNFLLSLGSSNAIFVIETNLPLSRAVLHIINTQDGSEHALPYGAQTVGGGLNFAVSVDQLNPSTDYAYEWELIDQSENENVTVTPRGTFTTLEAEDPFFIENQVYDTSVLDQSIALRVKLAEPPSTIRGVSRLYYRAVGSESWSKIDVPDLPQEGTLDVSPVDLLMSTDYEYKLEVNYLKPSSRPGVFILDTKTSQIQTFRTGG